MRRLWKSLSYHFREGGTTQVVRQATGRLMSWMHGHEEWLVYRLAGTQDTTADLRLLTEEVLGLADLIRLEYFKAIAFPEGITQRLKNGATCHGFFLDGMLANIAWMQPNVLELAPGLELDIGDGVSIYDCFTIPAHRGKGVYPATLRILGTHAWPVGNGQVFIAVDPGNHPSITGIERAGFVRVGYVSRSVKFGRASVLASGVNLATSAR